MRRLWVPTMVAPCMALAASASIDDGLKRAKEQASAGAVMAPIKQAPKPLELKKWRPGEGQARAGALQGAANNTPGTAQYLNLNSQWSDTLDVQDEQDWYYVHVPNGGKVTAFLSTVNDASLDYDLYAYRYNPVDGTLTPQSQSFYGPTHYEQVSATATAGEYLFFMAHAYQGADPVNPYTLVVLYSNAPDTDEPDDNPWQAKDVTAGLNATTRTLDNAFDEDWAVLNVSLQNTYTFSLNTAAAGNYQLQIFGANPGGAPAAVVNKNTTASYSLPPGTWYVRVLSLDTVEPGTNYTVRAGVAAASVVVSKVDSSTDGAFVNYGYGSAWRVRYNAIFIGSVTDMYGLPLPNAPIDITVNTPETITATTTVSGVSDANGQFNITVTLPPAWGRRTYQLYDFKHYYDLASYTLSSGGASTGAGLYHFAHSTYSPL
ncbi:hypothetical protein JQX13_17925 [Archangium violaceum]|uniref:hypothetical protein n=1 Tax=Archangium violaceum TaxID=83451 RepID=UPI00193AE27F|nr:hypothetical protein [Archangium violaceum]QRK11770.1 hypothetical protein JQX13_17925 [Archangium violaceum]